MRSLDGNVPIYLVETLEQVISKQVAPTRLFLLLVAAFAVTASVLAAVGLYGVMSYIVTQRSREIGIRVALGARREGIVGLIVRQGMQPAMVGLVVGLLGALAGGQVMHAVLFDVQPRDPAIFASVASLMMAVAVAAAMSPAIRASRLDPAKVLHAE